MLDEPVEADVLDVAVDVEVEVEVVFDVEVEVVVLAASRCVAVRSCPALRTLTPELLEPSSCATRFSNESFLCWFA